MRRFRIGVHNGRSQKPMQHIALGCAPAYHCIKDSLAGHIVERLCDPLVQLGG